jgi:cytochrome c peroxidase
MRALALTLLALCACGASHASQAGVTGAGGGATGGSATDGGATSCVPLAYPGGPYGTAAGAVLADRTWAGVSASGSGSTIALHALQAVCPDDPPIAILRIGASWCGTCRSYASHTKTLLGSDVGGSIRLMDVLLDDRDNAPSTPADAVAWQTLEDVVTPTGLDPAMSVGDLLPASPRLPLMVVVDARTMKIHEVLSAPTEDALEQSVRAALAAQHGAAPPVAPAPVLVDGRFSRDQWDLIAAMPLDTPPPADPSNAVADSIEAAALGGTLFSDPSLSPSDTVACVSCHMGAREFSDGHPTPPDGIGHGTRNAPSIILASYTRWQFWDGRADSLWSQALGPPENPNEFGSSRLFVAHAIYDVYRPEYEDLFGAMPPLSDTVRFPPNGMPGDPAFDGMSAADRQAVTRVYVNVGKTIAAFVRTLRGTQSTLDVYAAGGPTALTDAQKDGLLAFLRDGCAQCHWGPRLTDDAFHVLRFPTGSLTAGPDPGRQAGIPQLAAGEFDLGSTWSDDPSLARPVPSPGPWTLGAFKTPELRNVGLTAPYGHGGNYASLTDVVELIRAGGLPTGSALTEGTTEPWVAPFDEADVAPLATFLQSLQMSH